MYLLEFEKNF